MFFLISLFLFSPEKRGSAPGGVFSDLFVPFYSKEKVFERGDPERKLHWEVTMSRTVKVEAADSIAEAMRAIQNNEPWFFHAEMVEGKHDKFWEVWGVAKGEIRVRYGRNGSVGNTLLKPFSYFTKNSLKKIEKGYKVCATVSIAVPVPDSFDTWTYLSAIATRKKEKLEKEKQDEEFCVLLDEETEAAPVAMEPPKVVPPRPEKKKPSLKELAAKRRASSSW